MTDSKSSIDSEFESFEMIPKLKIDFPNNIDSDEPDLSSVITDKLKFSDDPVEYKFRLDELVDMQILAQTRNLVKKCTHKPSGHIMAVKYVRLPFKRKDVDNNKNILTCLREITLLSLLPSCEYVVEFYGCGQSEGDALICMELMDMSLNVS
jgi:hypothetical protein